MSARNARLTRLLVVAPDAVARSEASRVGAGVCDIVVVAGIEAALEHLGREPVDVLLCFGDASRPEAGLELISEAARRWPATQALLLAPAAPPSSVRTGLAPAKYLSTYCLD